jgi:hypothetical protein
VGDWTFEGEAVAAADQPAQKQAGSEHGRMVGSWAVMETAGESPLVFTGVLTVGYDSAQKRCVGTWISSVSDTVVLYDGGIDVSGKVLTLENTVPDGTRYRDSIELVDGDRKILRSTMEIDGKWITFLTHRYQRKK